MIDRDEITAGVVSVSMGLLHRELDMAILVFAALHGLALLVIIQTEPVVGTEYILMATLVGLVDRLAVVEVDIGVDGLDHGAALSIRRYVVVERLCLWLLVFSRSVVDLECIIHSGDIVLGTLDGGQELHNMR